MRQTNNSFPLQDLHYAQDEVRTNKTSFMSQIQVCKTDHGSILSVFLFTGIRFNTDEASYFVLQERENEIQKLRNQVNEYLKLRRFDIVPMEIFNL